MTLKDLFTNKQDYLVQVSLKNGNFLYIEGCDSNGCAITSDNFDIKNIKSLCVELIDNTGDYIDTIDTFDMNINNTIEELIKRSELK